MEGRLGGAFFVHDTPHSKDGEVGKSKPGAAYQGICLIGISCSYTTYMLGIVCIELQHPFHTLIPCSNNGRHNGGLALDSTLH
jgi:hypothetical protein